MNISIRQGETVKLETSVLDVTGQAADLSGAIVKFAIKKKDVDTVVIKDPTVLLNVISLTLDSTDTSEVGEYFYEFRIKLNGEEDSVDFGKIQITRALVYGL